MSRLHLHIGHCFATLRRFAEGVTKANKVYVLDCQVSALVPKGVVAAGMFVIRYEEDGPAYEIGRWAVRESGNIDVSLGAINLPDSPYDLAGRMLNEAWNNGVITQAIKFAKRVEMS